MEDSNDGFVGNSGEGEASSDAGKKGVMILHVRLNRGRSSIIHGHL